MAAKKLSHVKPSWLTLKPHRGGVALKRVALLGHLYWWREGKPADDLVVPGGVTPDDLDWADFPHAPPVGYEAGPPKKRLSGGASTPMRQDERTSKQINVTLPPEAHGALARIMVRYAGNKSAAVAAAILAFDEKD